MIFLQLLINAAIAGSLYALAAFGYAIIYSSNRFVHFAHGAVATVGAYVFYVTFADRWPPLVAALVSVLASALVGAIMFASVYYPLQKRKASSTILLIASLGLMILTENILLLSFGADVKLVNLPSWHVPLTIFGAVITPLQIFIIVLSLVLPFGALLCLRKTKWGTLIRAVADNPELAQTTGINVYLVRFIGIVLGSAFAGGAGVLIALEQNLDPFIGTALMIGAFASAIVGGTRSLPGAILGAFVIGIVENFGVWFVPSGYKYAMSFTLLLIFLLFRPSGILGINKGVRE
jgi:branched-chain amino acid transport system permease protein